MSSLVRRLGILAMLCGTLALGGCGSSGDDDTTGDDDDSSSTSVDSTFTSINENIFQPTCAVPGCHASSASSGQLNLEGDAAYTSLVNVASSQVPTLMRVKPNDPDNSYLYIKLEGKAGTVNGTDTQMPLAGNHLTDQQMQAIKDWINNGAPND